MNNPNPSLFYTNLGIYLFLVCYPLNKGSILEIICVSTNNL